MLLFSLAFHGAEIQLVSKDCNKSLARELTPFSWRNTRDPFGSLEQIPNPQQN